MMLEMITGCVSSEEEHKRQEKKGTFWSRSKSKSQFPPFQETIGSVCVSLSVP